MTWDEHADGWDDNGAVRAYSRAAFESLTAQCEKRGVRQRGARVLDFGCGTGLLTEKLSPLCEQVVAIDTSPKMIEVLRKKLERLGVSNVQTSTATIDDLVDRRDGLVSEPFDVIVCSSVCAFLDDFPGTAKMLVGLLRPGGLFVQWDWELDPSSDEPFGLTRGQIEAALAGAGLEAIGVDTAFDVTFEAERMRPLMGVGQAPNGT